MSDRGSQPEYMALRFPKEAVTLHARLEWNMNPRLCHLLVDNLPIETIFSHTTASGQGMYAPTRIVGAVEAKHALLTELPHGTVTLSTDRYKTIGLFYGRITEPLPGFPAVAQIVEEDMAALQDIGWKVWISNYVTHEPVKWIAELDGWNGGVR